MLEAFVAYIGDEIERLGVCHGFLPVYIAG